MVNTKNVIWAYINDDGLGCFSWEKREGAIMYQKAPTYADVDVLWAEDAAAIRCHCGNEVFLSESATVECECGHKFRYSCTLEEVTNMATSLGKIQLWVVGRNVGDTWEFFGVFDTKEQADDQCKDETYFVGPVTLNAVLPTEA